MLIGRHGPLIKRNESVPLKICRVLRNSSFNSIQLKKLHVLTSWCSNWALAEDKQYYPKNQNHHFPSPFLQIHFVFQIAEIFKTDPSDNHIRVDCHLHQKSKQWPYAIKLTGSWLCSYPGLYSYRLGCNCFPHIQCDWGLWRNIWVGLKKCWHRG